MINLEGNSDFPTGKETYIQAMIKLLGYFRNPNIFLYQQFVDTVLFLIKAHALLNTNPPKSSKNESKNEDLNPRALLAF